MEEKMEITVEVFETAIRILKENQLIQVSESLSAIRNHLQVLEGNRDALVEKLKQSVVFYKKYENQMEWRKVGIQQDRLHTWSPLLKEHQKANVFQDVKSATVQRIIEAKNEVDHIDMSVSEVRLRLMERAKEVRKTMAEIGETKIKIFVMEVAIDVSGFLEARQVAAKEIPDYEVGKLYNLYMQEVIPNG